MSEIGKLVKELRGRMSLREASEKIGISHTYLDTIEKGFDKRSGKQINPSPDTLRLISDAYKYSYVKLLRLAGYVDEVDEDDEEDFGYFITDPTLRRWHKELPKSDEEDLKKLMEMWKILRNQ
jgi:transcriptional regulator with XRE-family HTH domain